MATTTILSCLLAFVIGGVPFGYLIGRLVLKDDIRRHGSGNIGATNVARVIGWKWGSVVLVLDAIKGLVPTLGVRMVMAGQADTDGVLLATILTGISAIVGHMYPIWLKLRGGKGVATALGVVLVISPWASIAAFVLFLSIVAITRIVALASIIASMGFAITQLWMMGRSAFDVSKLPLTLFSVIVPGLIIWRHRSNIARMWQGQENRIAGRSKLDESSNQNAT